MESTRTSPIPLTAIQHDNPDSPNFSDLSDGPFKDSIYTLGHEHHDPTSRPHASRPRPSRLSQPETGARKRELPNSLLISGKTRGRCRLRTAELCPLPADDLARPCATGATKRQPWLAPAYSSPPRNHRTGTEKSKSFGPQTKQVRQAVCTEATTGFIIGSPSISSGREQGHQEINAEDVIRMIGGSYRLASIAVDIATEELAR
ncbi:MULTISPECIES: hypothetical protein [unclassified Bradyrhizobium]|uniref:hypothetical protein n=1 Tax=unclassified Bradyrhizobium TaxID=2631580 RepID=UPI00247ACC6C|nr:MULTISPECIES: hypothetical protein [unclassified Bradyrhizobium]WGS20177.1 hypothetical protein MTX22_38810 [Bradyrhizobium sp. ISRA463]WGS27040.1 hypothetical protein MTX19_36235 [Bradyrhizobium sp. ISRA464]